MPDIPIHITDIPIFTGLNTLRCDVMCFRLVYKGLGTNHKLTEVTATQVEYTCGLTQRLSHADTWLYYENGTEVNCTYQCHAPAKFLSFSIPCVAFCLSLHER